MNPWVFIGICILIIIVAILLFSMGFTWLILMLADRHARKMIDLHAKKAVALLPRTNCGKCGYESCYECARAMVCSQESPSACAEGDDALTEALFAVVAGFQAETKRPEDKKPVKRGWIPRSQDEFE